MSRPPQVPVYVDQHSEDHGPDQDQYNVTMRLPHAFTLYLPTVEVELDDTAQGLTLPDPVTGEHTDFFCLPLGENPTAYDRYLVRARDVEPAWPS